MSPSQALLTRNGRSGYAARAWAFFASIQRTMAGHALPRPIGQVLTLPRWVGRLPYRVHAAIQSADTGVADRPASPFPSPPMLGISEADSCLDSGGGGDVALRRRLDTLVGPELRLPLPTVSAVLDNGILLRRFELGAQLQRLISVIKMRQSATDPDLRNFDISDQGITIGEPFARATALLTGSATPVGMAELPL